MSKLSNKQIGLRDIESNKIISVYPDKIKGSDKEIEKTVKDWHYKQSCKAERDLSSSFVDTLTSEEIESQSLQ